jgi:hypothetical protein
MDLFETAQHTVQIRGSHKRDVYAEVTMIGRAVQAEVNGKGNGSPCWILCAAVETYLFGICQWVGNISGIHVKYYLIRSLGFEFGEQIGRLGFGSCGSHVGQRKKKNRGMYGEWEWW